MRAYCITTITTSGQRNVRYGLFANDWDAIEHSLCDSARRVTVRRVK